jgi:hypothetical protein
MLPLLVSDTPLPLAAVTIPALVMFHRRFPIDGIAGAPPRLCW